MDTRLFGGKRPNQKPSLLFQSCLAFTSGSGVGGWCRKRGRVRRCPSLSIDHRANRPSQVGSARFPLKRITVA